MKAVHLFAVVVSLPNGSGFYAAPSLGPSKASVSNVSSTTAPLANSSIDTSTKFWKWRGHDIFTEVRRRSPSKDDDTKKPAVILLHGFGASTVYWRETMSVLQSEGHDVHALDLLGQGRSSKPFPIEEGASENGDSDEVDAAFEIGKNTGTKVEYSINLWASLLDDYARHHQLDEVVLMGNSLGSLVALSAATGDFMDSETKGYLPGNRVKGLCLFNCAVGLNSQNVIKNPDFNPVQRAAIKSLFGILNTLIFDNQLLLRYALNNIVTQELLEDALKSLYISCPERVDKELVDSFYYPAKLGGEGAVEAIRQIYTNDAGLTPMEYHEKYPEILDAIPLHLVWGLEDVVTPINGDVGMFYCDRVANNRSGRGTTTIDCVKGGHILFDDNPEDSHASMMRWLERKVIK